MLTEKTWGQDCVIGEQKNKERNGKTPLRMGKYFDVIVKQLLNSAFVGYEEFCRSWITPSVDNTFLDLQNSTYPTQPHSIIAKYCSNLLFKNVLYFVVHAFGSLNFYLEHSKFTDLLNSIRSKCESCATWPDPAKAIKASLVRFEIKIQGCH